MIASVWLINFLIRKLENNKIEENKTQKLPLKNTVEFYTKHVEEKLTSSTKNY